MVELELKALPMRNGAIFDYRKQLTEVIMSVPPMDPNGAQKRGFFEDDMIEAQNLVDKVETANGKVEFTSAEAIVIWGKVKNTAWPFADDAFYTFIRDVKKLINE